MIPWQLASSDAPSFHALSAIALTAGRGSPRPCDEPQVRARVALVRELAAELAALAQVGHAHRRVRPSRRRAAAAVVTRARRDERHRAHERRAGQRDDEGEQDAA